MEGESREFLGAVAVAGGLVLAAVILHQVPGLLWLAEAGILVLLVAILAAARILAIVRRHSQRRAED